MDRSPDLNSRGEKSRWLTLPYKSTFIRPKTYSKRKCLQPFQRNLFSTFPFKKTFSLKKKVSHYYQGVKTAKFFRLNEENLLSYLINCRKFILVIGTRLDIFRVEITRKMCKGRMLKSYFEQSLRASKIISKELLGLPV